MGTDEILLEVKDLHIEFYDHIVPETAVEDFDLTLRKGEIVGLVGESGSGKSLSAHAIAGLLRRRDMTRRGQILFQGRDLLTCDRETLRGFQGDEISIIFQEPMTSLNPVRRIGWQVEESLRIHKRELDREARRARALEMLEAVGLQTPERIYAMYPHELSGGMRQRVMIAAAMIAHPQILIADEPTTALDVTIQEQIVDLLKRINEREQTAILFISHDLSLVSRICSRVLVMQKGRVVEDGPAKRVFAAPRDAYTKALIAAIPRVPDFSKEDTAGAREDGDLVLEASGLNVFYRDRSKSFYERNRKTQTLFDINVSVREGEALGIAGESGSGKSTLARTIAGIHRDYTGKLRLKYPDPQMVFQDPYGSLNPARRIGWLLEEPLRTDRTRTWTKEERQARIREVLAQVELPESHLERYPAQLSGGQRQRVCIGVALMRNPRLLIADEAVSALDVTIQAQILELMKTLHKRLGLTVLFISHDLRVLYQFCGRILIMKDGRICEQGETREIYARPQHPYTKTLLRAAGIAGQETG